MADHNYDFIVIGGGSSGCNLAYNLAQKGPTLLIERGANYTAYPVSSVREGWPQISGLALNRIRASDSGHWTGSPNIFGCGSALNGGACWSWNKRESRRLGENSFRGI